MLSGDWIYSRFCSYPVSGGRGVTDIRYFVNALEPSDADLKWDSEFGLSSRIIVAGGGGGVAKNDTYTWTKSSTVGHAGGAVPCLL